MAYPWGIPPRDLDHDWLSHDISLQSAPLSHAYSLDLRRHPSPPLAVVSRLPAARLLLRSVTAFVAHPPSVFF